MPQGARPGKAGDRCAEADVPAGRDAWVSACENRGAIGEEAAVLTVSERGRRRSGQVSRPRPAVGRRSYNPPSLPARGGGPR
ncbi:hypothetical protein GCM10023235_29950 [Kitasatospora terrestris]|uniref:Uncharacterized protein n=1 Tax=Kitasatospora terrestris TaxID=258051 RepID=A0ABP9DM60_9ACTN